MSVTDPSAAPFMHVQRASVSPPTPPSDSSDVVEAQMVNIYAEDTLRALVAAQALQGLCATGGFNSSAMETARRAVTLGDALLAELRRTKK